MSQDTPLVRSLAGLATYILVRISVAVVLFCYSDTPDDVFNYLGHSKVSDSYACLRLMINSLTVHSFLGLFGCTLKKFSWIQMYAFLAWINLLVPMIINLNTSVSSFSFLNIMYLLDFVINFALCRNAIIQMRESCQHTSPMSNICLVPKYDPPPKYEDVAHQRDTYPPPPAQEVV